MRRKTKLLVVKLFFILLLLFGFGPVADAATSAPLVISEVFNNDNKAGLTDYIEIFNAGNEAIDLSQYQLIDYRSDLTYKQLNLTGWLEPKDWVLLVPVSAGTQVKNIPLEKQKLMDFNMMDAIEQLILVTDSGEVVDGVAWGNVDTVLKPGVSKLEQLLEPGSSVRREEIFEDGIKGDFKFYIRPNPGVINIQIAPPSLVADTKENNQGESIDITFADQPGWREAISQIKIEGKEINKSDFASQGIEILEGNIMIDGANFPTPGTYRIELTADWYHLASVDQVINNVLPPTPFAYELEQPTVEKNGLKAIVKANIRELTDTGQATVIFQLTDQAEPLQVIALCHDMPSAGEQVQAIFNLPQNKPYTIQVFIWDSLINMVPKAESKEVTL